MERALLTLGLLVLAGLVLGGILALGVRALLPEQDSAPMPAATSGSAAGEGNPAGGGAPGSASPSAVPPAGAGGGLRPESVTAYDPQGDGREGDATTDRVLDGNPDTSWQTERYNSAELSGLKDGVGLLVDLGAERQVSGATVRFTGPGASVQLRAASSADADLDGTRLLAEAENGGETVTLTPATPAGTRYVVIWLTALPAADSGYRAQISELTVRG